MKEITKTIIDYFNNGYSMIEVSKILSISYKRVESVKRRYHVAVNKVVRNNVNHWFLDNIDSDLKAYILGFFIADGNISRTGRVTFCVSRIDDRILHKIHECFVANNVVYINKQNGAKFRKEQALYRFTSTHLLQVLQIKYNIHARKTFDYSFEFPLDTIPKQYWGGFVRGLWDGDGSYEYNRGTFTPRCCINSPIFAEQIGRLIKQYTDLDFKVKEHIGKTCNYWVLRLYANRINKVDKIDKLYRFLYDSDTLSLYRKKYKFIKYLKYRANSSLNKDGQCNA